MNHNYYKISDIYKSKILKEDFSMNSASRNTNNSYETVDSMMGTGRGPVVGSDAGLSQKGNNVMFPSDEEISNTEKSQMLIKFFKKEIDEGTWDEKSKSKFKDLLHHLLGYKQSNKNKTEDEIMKDAR